MSFLVFESFGVSWASVLPWGTHFSSLKNQNKCLAVLGGKIQTLMYVENYNISISSTFTRKYRAFNWNLKLFFIKSCLSDLSNDFCKKDYAFSPQYIHQFPVFLEWQCEKLCVTNNLWVQKISKFFANYCKVGTWVQSKSVGSFFVINGLVTVISKTCCNLYLCTKMSSQRHMFSNLSCMFLNPNYFFQFEFIRSEKPPGIS